MDVRVAPRQAANPGKFSDPDVTLTGARRATVRLRRLDTLWFNTGTLCNIECANCYIESSPVNDRLTYLTTTEVTGFLDEIERDALGTRVIGFTGGEPFMNPDMIAMTAKTLERGFEVLILTNAMQPMQRPQVRDGLRELIERFAEKLTLRISLDHHTPALHDTERGAGGWEKTMAGMRWLAAQGCRLNVAGRSCWGETESAARAGYARLFAAEGFNINADDPEALVIFPEMDEAADVPEITTDCWNILGVKPESIMCASSRMVVKRRAAAAPAVVSCTLLPYDTRFEMGRTLAQAGADVRLNHVHCARFCVLGGGSCSAS